MSEYIYFSETIKT